MAGSIQDHDSGIDWLGFIPAEWKLLKLKYVTQFINGCAFKPTEWAEAGLPIIRIENLNGGEDFNRTTRLVNPRYKVSKGDLLFGWSGNRGTSFGPFIWWRDGEYLLNQHIFRLEGFALNKSYFFWVLKAVTLYVESQVSGIIGLVHITKEDIGNIKIPVMSLPEQRAIAAFLDCKTAVIDALIDKKQRMIELLHEKRQALISHAVTKGLNSGAPMRDSGIEWLGCVPAHWQIARLKFQMLSIEQGWSPQCDNRQAEPGEWGVLKVGCMNSGIYDEEENKVLPSTEVPLPEYEVRTGDVLMSRSNTVELVGAVGMVHKTQGRILLCDKLYRLTFDQRKLLPTYSVSVLRSNVARTQIERDASGASPSMKNISNDRVRDLLLPIPPLKEQRSIEEWIGKKTSQLDGIANHTLQHIGKLMEYRQAVIAAAVTGQIDMKKEIG